MSNQLQTMKKKGVALWSLNLENKRDLMQRKSWVLLRTRRPCSLPLPRFVAGKRSIFPSTNDNIWQLIQIQALRKEPLTVYGNDKQTGSFQYVSNLVEGLMWLMEGNHVGPFNLGNPGEFTMLELAQVVQDTIDPNARIELRPNTEDDPHKRKPDISKAKELLGWEPTVSLRKGLPLMATDFRQRIFGDARDNMANAEAA